jgi:hypothetical protein
MRLIDKRTDREMRNWFRIVWALVAVSILTLIATLLGCGGSDNPGPPVMYGPAQLIDAGSLPVEYGPLPLVDGGSPDTGEPKVYYGPVQTPDGG